jgi:hypothetical protein
MRRSRDTWSPPAQAAADLWARRTDRFVIGLVRLGGEVLYLDVR